MPGVKTPGVAAAANKACCILRFCSTSLRVTTRNTSSTPSPDSALTSWHASQPTSWPQKPEERLLEGERGSVLWCGLRGWLRRRGLGPPSPVPVVVVLLPSAFWFSCRDASPPAPRSRIPPRPAIPDLSGLSVVVPAVVTAAIVSRVIAPVPVPCQPPPKPPLLKFNTPGIPGIASGIPKGVAVGGGVDPTPGFRFSAT